LNGCGGNGGAATVVLGNAPQTGPNNIVLVAGGGGGGGGSSEDGAARDSTHEPGSLYNTKNGATRVGAQGITAGTSGSSNAGGGGGGGGFPNGGAGGNPRTRGYTGGSYAPTWPGSNFKITTGDNGGYNLAYGTSSALKFGTTYQVSKYNDARASVDGSAGHLSTLTLKIDNTTYSYKATGVYGDDTYIGFDQSGVYGMEGYPNTPYRKYLGPGPGETSTFSFTWDGVATPGKKASVAAGAYGRNGGNGYVSISFLQPAKQDTVTVKNYVEELVVTPGTREIAGYTKSPVITQKVIQVPVTTTIEYEQHEPVEQTDFSYKPLIGTKIVPTTIRGSSTTSGNLSRYTTYTTAPTARVNITGTDGVVGTTTYNTPKYFNSLTTYPSGNYRVQYVDGAWSQRLDELPFAGGCYIAYKNSGNATQIDPIGNKTIYTSYTNAISASRNYFGTNQPYCYDFFHNGGEIYVCAGDSIYSDNRAATEGAPLWSLYTVMSTAAFNFIISTKS
jgi:hypothetical protein